jgi:hypothetical protein
MTHLTSDDLGCPTTLCGTYTNAWPAGDNPADATQFPGQPPEAGDFARSIAVKWSHLMAWHERDAFRTEPALGPLRDRDDFGLLLMDLAFPAEPFVR